VSSELSLPPESGPPEPGTAVLRAVPSPQPRRQWLSEGWLLFAADAAAVAAAATMRWPAVAFAVVLPALAAAGLYRPRLRLSALDDAGRVVAAVGLSWALTSWLGAWPAARAWLAPTASLRWWAGLAAGLLLARSVSLAVLRRLRRAGGGAPTLIVGAGPAGVRLARALRTHSEYGLRPVGLVGRPDDEPDARLPLPLLGPTGELCEMAERSGASHLVVACAEAPDAELVAALRECQQRGRTVLVVPLLSELNVARKPAGMVAGVPLVRVPPPGPRRRSWRLKRLLDIVASGLSLLLLSPVLLACALAVRWECRRDGVIFRQERVGQNGTRFRMLKFRSLTPSSEFESRALWNVGDDRRIGPVGRVLRRTCLDELPQLVNVLKGEMSLVGPRPERPFFVERFGRRHRHYLHRHRVPGGITGWAQVHGLRGDTSIEERAAFDNYYIDNWSLGLDLSIMLRTVGALLPARGGGESRSGPAGSRPSGDAS
jgi:exopolysaccharide biosynthesis polyprenyl glycosylphosphotransferase